MSEGQNPSGTGMRGEYTQGPGAGTSPESLNKSQASGGAYNEVQSSQSGGNMGGGHAAPASGVAGGNESNQSQAKTAPQSSQPSAEKQDWLDKGISSVGKKFGANISDKNADTAGDFANKQFQSKSGRGIPGVQ